MSDPKQLAELVKTLVEMHYAYKKPQGKASLGNLEVRQGMTNRSSNQSQKGGKRYNYSNLAEVSKAYLKKLRESEKIVDGVTINPNHDDIKI